VKRIHVNLKENSYDIIVGHNILSDLGVQIRALNIGNDAIVVTNSIIRKLHGKALSKSLAKQGIQVKFFEVPDSERSKSVKVAFGLIQQIASADVRKRMFIIAFGGGVIGDLAGFVAAVYKRGIPFVQVPTTFLAQIDSAIGGKVAIDLPVGKNLIGSFYQPKIVFSDVALLRTLSERQVRNGLAEAIKYGVIKDKKLFTYIEKNAEKLLSVDLKAMTLVVLGCSRIKAEIVAADEKELKGLRTILNFGHTAGHALESACAYNRYQHGEAISLGMRIASAIACQRKMMCSKEFHRLEKLLDKVGLPAKAKGVRIDSLMKAVLHDKKIIAKKNRLVLPQGIGRVKVVEGVPTPMIKQMVKRYIA